MEGVFRYCKDMIIFKETKPLKEYDSVSLAEMLREHFILTYPAAQVQKLGDAIQVASYLHRHDVRRGNRGKLPNPPYIEHPLRVALRLVRFEVKNPDLIIASILHDTVEDHPFEFAEFESVRKTDDPHIARAASLEFIARQFGYNVASIVEDVSNPLSSSVLTKEEKVAAYLSHVKTVIWASPSACLLKVSDFVDNAGSLHHHYQPGDTKVNYFLNRYSPLLSQYRMAIEDVSDPAFNRDAVLNRLNAVEDQFNMFRSHEVRRGL